MVEESEDVEKYVFADIDYQRLFFENQNCIVLLFHDITDIQQNVALKERNKVLNFMQSSVSHEMLTPLKCISSIVELLKGESKLPRSVTENLDTIRSTVTFVQA